MRERERERERERVPMDWMGYAAHVSVIIYTSREPACRLKPEGVGDDKEDSPCRQSHTHMRHIHAFGAPLGKYTTYRYIDRHAHTHA